VLSLGCFERKAIEIQSHLVRGSPSLRVRVMGFSWKNEVRGRSLISTLSIFPITMETTKALPDDSPVSPSG